MSRKKVDEVWVSTEGLLVPWDVIERMIAIYQDKIDTYKELKAPQAKIDYRRGQKAAFEAMLSYKENLIEESHYVEGTPELAKDYID